MSQNGINSCESLRKPTFHGATNGSPGKLRQGNERRNSKLMTYHYPDRGSASDWSCREGRRSTTQIWKVYVINIENSELVYQTSCISRGNQWRCREMSVVSSGYSCPWRCVNLSFALLSNLYFFRKWFYWKLNVIKVRKRPLNIWTALKIKHSKKW